jgi:hypothetical protein
MDYGFFNDCETADPASVFVVGLDAALFKALDAFVSIVLLVCLAVPD